MKIETNTDEAGSIVLKEVFNGVYFEAESGNKLAVVMRDDGFEICAIPKGSSALPWAVVNMETGQADSLLNPRPLTNNNTVAWAVDRWNQEVKNRPLVNVHRRTLDDTWRQVIKHHGGNPNQLLGPTHDMLVWLRDNPTEKIDIEPEWKSGCASVWEAPTTPVADAIEPIAGGLDVTYALKP